MFAKPSPRRLAIASAALSTVLALSACSSGQEPPAAGGPSTSPTPSPSASPSASPSPHTAIPRVRLALLFRKAKAFRFKPGKAPVRSRAKKAFERLLGDRLSDVKVRRVLRTSAVKARALRERREKRIRRHGSKKERRKLARRPPHTPPVQATVIAISVRLSSDEEVVDFMSQTKEALSQQSSSILTKVAGKSVFFSKDATPLHQARAFFFVDKAAVLQVFGRAGFVKDLSRSLLKAAAKGS